MDKYIRKWFNLVSYLHFDEANKLLLREELSKEALVRKFITQIRGQWFNNLKQGKVNVSQIIRYGHWLEKSVLSFWLHSQIRQVISFYDKKNPMIAKKIREEVGL